MPCSHVLPYSVFQLRERLTLRRTVREHSAAEIRQAVAARFLDHDTLAVVDPLDDGAGRDPKALPHFDRH